jgi:hypothetical protein
VEVKVATSPTVSVRVSGGAGGFASLVAQYLEQTLAESVEAARALRRLRGRIGVTASDHEASITLDLRGGEISIEPGANPPLDTAVVAPWSALLELLRGEGHPLRDHLRRRLRIRWSARRPLLPLQAYRLLRLRPTPRGVRGSS